jgi:hypothetical protein
MFTLARFGELTAVKMEKETNLFNLCHGTFKMCLHNSGTFFNLCRENEPGHFECSMAQTVLINFFFHFN